MIDAVGGDGDAVIDVRGRRTAALAYVAVAGQNPLA
jgi:hypothetical protein